MWRHLSPSDVTSCPKTSRAISYVTSGRVPMMSLWWRHMPSSWCRVKVNKWRTWWRHRQTNDVTRLASWARPGVWSAKLLGPGEWGQSVAGDVRRSVNCPSLLTCPAPVPGLVLVLSSGGSPSDLYVSRRATENRCASVMFIGLPLISATTSPHYLT